MDSEARDIPITEDDQGEGWKDPIEPIDALETMNDRLQREEWKRQERLRRNITR